MANVQDAILDIASTVLANAEALVDEICTIARQMRLALLDHDLEMLSNLIRQLEEMADGI